MGEVYRATDSVLGRVVAVKMLAERYARDPGVRARFKREALAAAQLSAHRHVVTVFDVGEHEGRPFIVMEYLPGGSVHDRLRAARVDAARALEWLAGAAEGLDAAHAVGIVHRDVKPANLLLDDSESVHVTDFGIAFAAGEDTLTLPGTVLGTAGYLAPEQARGEPATAASDRYALGVVAFELLTGRRPFAGDTPVTEAFAHINAEVPSAERIEPGLPAGVDGALARALAKDPSERPTTSRELVEDLRAAFREDATPTLVQAPAPVAARVPAPVAVTPPAPSRHSRGARRSFRYAFVALAAVLAALGAVAIVAVLGDDDPRREVPTQTATDPPPPPPTPPAEPSPPPPPPADPSPPPTPPSPPPPTSPPPPSPPAGNGAALNDAGFARMEAGDFAGALPLLEGAVTALSGSGTLAEAYASFNLANTRFALGSCDGVLELLDRSEAVQGDRREIDRLRRAAEKSCGDSGRGDKDGKGEEGDD